MPCSTTSCPLASDWSPPRNSRASRTTSKKKQTTEPMPLATGTRLGPYEILGALGAGGMGEVYRARDTKLNRDVALKILPRAFASDPDRLARFRREAQVLASLNHPHIAQIHGFEDSVATHALVMELVEGPTLADLIGSGMAVREALAVARQIAEALEAAHERGIVHRDLKPANVKVRPDGTVKVLDFGLAKALGPEGTGAASDAMLSPTLTGRATQLGVILGTAAYMAPEQARGKTVDRRADMWAFGCVFFEMLTGRRTFGGDEISDVLAEVIKSEPDWAALPADTPPAIRRLLRRCLTKDPKDRQADASTARLDIDDALLPSEMASPIGSPPRARRRDRMMWSTALLVTAIAASVVTALYYRRALTAVQAPPEARLHIIVPPMPDNAFFSISPDGRSVVFEAAAERGQGDQLWLRPLDQESAKALPGTESVFDAAWSPDSGSLAFLANQKLKRIDLASLAVQTLADAATPRGVSWGADGTILFAPGGNGPLYRISAAGGRPEPATALRSTREASHRDPRFLPDGRHFLVWVLGEAETRGEYVGSLGSTDIRRLFDADGPADVAPPDHLLFVREGVLYAQRFDMRTLEPAGEPVPVAANVFASPTDGTAVSASSAGPIAYRTATGARQ
jgi:serine/threonine protein kinase